MKRQKKNDNVLLFVFCRVHTIIYPQKVVNSEKVTLSSFYHNHVPWWMDENKKAKVLIDGKCWNKVILLSTK